MLFNPVVERHGETSTVYLEAPRVVVEGVNFDTAREIAKTLTDRFEILGCEGEDSFTVLVHDEGEFTRALGVPTWGAALDVVAHHSQDLALEDSPEDSEGAEDSKIPARGETVTFGRTGAFGSETKSDESFGSLRFLHENNLLGAAIQLVDEVLGEGKDLDQSCRNRLESLREVVAHVEALIGGEYGRRKLDEGRAVGSRCAPVSSVVPPKSSGAPQHLGRPIKRANHLGEDKRVLTRQSTVDRSFDGLEDGYLA